MHPTGPNRRCPKGAEPRAARRPDAWKTGDEPGTAAQRSYLETLATEAGESIDTAALTKADASKLIDELQEKTGRGRAAPNVVSSQTAIP